MSSTRSTRSHAPAHAAGASSSPPPLPLLPLLSAPPATTPVHLAHPPLRPLQPINANINSTLAASASNAASAARGTLMAGGLASGPGSSPPPLLNVGGSAASASGSGKAPSSKAVAAVAAAAAAAAAAGAPPGMADMFAQMGMPMATPARGAAGATAAAAAGGPNQSAAEQFLAAMASSPAGRAHMLAATMHAMQAMQAHAAMAQAGGPPTAGTGAAAAAATGASAGASAAAASGAPSNEAALQAMTELAHSSDPAAVAASSAALSAFFSSPAARPRTGVKRGHAEIGDAAAAAAAAGTDKKDNGDDAKSANDPESKNLAALLEVARGGKGGTTPAKNKPFSFSKANLTLHALNTSADAAPIVQYHPNSFHVTNKHYKRPKKGAAGASMAPSYLPGMAAALAAAAANTTPTADATVSAIANAAGMDVQPLPMQLPIQLQNMVGMASAASASGMPLGLMNLPAALGLWPEEPRQDDDESSHNSRARYCLPCPLILNLPKVPLQTLYLQVQKQYTISKKEMEQRQMTAAQCEELVSVPVRIMGSATDLKKLYFVAKDVCLLIFIRKGNVAKSIGQFLQHEKARLPVLCPRSNGTSSTHVLTALSIDGVKRLLRNSKSPLALHVLKFLMGHIQNLESIIRESKAPNPSLQQSFYATVTGQGHITERPKPEAGSAEAAEDERAGAGMGAGADEDDGEFANSARGSGRARRNVRPSRSKSPTAAAAAAAAGGSKAGGSAAASSSGGASMMDDDAAAASFPAPPPVPMVDEMLPAFPLASQFPSTSPAQLAREQDSLDEQAAVQGTGAAANSSYIMRRPQPKIFATITPQSLTIAPSSPNAQPKTFAVEPLPPMQQ